MSFVLVEHTHNNIDALFGRWSKKPKKNDYPTLPLLMKLFMNVGAKQIFLHVIEEVPYFKVFIDCKGCTTPIWPSKENGCIHLWKEDNCGKHMLPIGQHMALPPRDIRNLDKIVKSISRFIDMWKSLARDDVVEEYQKTHHYLIQN
jgi:hypothetical protein